MGAIDDETRKGAQSAYAHTSTVNQTRFQTTQAIKREVQTSFFGRVDKCESKEETTGATYVSVTPMTAQTDAEGNKLEMVSIPKLPFVRHQQGIAAFVLDPVPGDLGIISVVKHDISNIKQGVTEPQPPASARAFSQSDGVYVGAVHTKVPTNHITLRQDDTLYSRCPQGYEWETDKTIQETAGEDRIIELGRDKSETIGQNYTQEVGKDSNTTVQGNWTLTVNQDGTATITGNFTGTIQGDATLTVQGNATVSVNGDLTASVQGAANATVQGAVNVTTSSTATLKATAITLDAPETTITGNLSLAGNLSAGGGGGGGGTGTFTGSVVAQQTITGEQDVVGHGISLKDHTHGGVESGPSSTGRPQ